MWMLTTFQTQVMEVLFGTLVAADPQWPQRVRSIVGARIRIRVDDLPIDLVFQPFEDSVKIWPAASGDEDVCLHGNWQAFVAAAKIQKAGASGAVEGLQVHGNAMIAQTFTAALIELTPDWRSKLTPWLGSAAADTVVQALENLTQFIRRLVAQGKASFVDVGRHHLELMAERAAFRDFQAELVALSSDVARVQARLERLERLLA